jgi:selenide,water dikinase
MAVGSRCGMIIRAGRVPVIPLAKEYSAMGMVPAGTYANRNYCQKSLEVDPGVPAPLLDILADAQTSGGLLIAVAADRAGDLLERLRAKGVMAAAEIGEVTSGPPGTIRVVH